MLIAVDIMGSDTSPEVLFEGILMAASHFGKDCSFKVLATQEVIEKCQHKAKDISAIEFEKVDEEILMEDSPLLVVRRKHNSSMAVGIQLIRDKKCNALVTAGNTGAVTAYSSLELKKLSGIDRPALLTLLPSEKGRVAILDVGANVTFRPQYLMQFALMGAAYQKIVGDIKNPKIGLLNIGGEARKGTRIVRQAYDYFNHYSERLEDNHLFFEGNVEGRDVFEGKVDVLVTDGFTGNVFLKTCEGVSSFIIDQVMRRLGSPTNARSKESLKQLEKYLDYAEYPGAVLLGVDGVIVKCHGRSSKQAMFNGIKGAFELAKNTIIEKIESHLKIYKSDLSLTLTK